MAKFAVIKSLISQDVSTLRRILWWEIRAILWQLRRNLVAIVRKLVALTSAAILHDGGLIYRFCVVKICRGGAVLAIKFVVLRETCAVTLRRS